MFFNQPTIEMIKQRYSCRIYQDRPVEESLQAQVIQFLAANTTAPFGSQVRFALVAAIEQDRRALRGLGTYGFIKDAAGFIIGAVGSSKKNMEDYGYLMERAILFATGIGLGTCWLGGFFTRSSFARKLDLHSDEFMPAVASTGYAVENSRARDAIRKRAGSDNRFQWETLFFEEEFGKPISNGQVGAYAGPLEMVRQGPSASNKQPWRIVRQGHAWHFYLHRTPGYGSGLVSLFLRKCDLQRVDLGIAMCHFELTAREAGLDGSWVEKEPGITKPDGLTEYSVSWFEA
jgi:nitroreductase